MPLKKGTVPPYFVNVPLYLVKPRPLYPHSGRLSVIILTTKATNRERVESGHARLASHTGA